MYFLFIELSWAHKADAVHPLFIRFNVHHYESLPSIITHRYLPSGFYLAGANKDYIIGVILYGHLWPLTARTADYSNKYERVKVRINDNQIVPILKTDPLNDLFFKKFGPKNIRFVEIPDLKN